MSDLAAVLAPHYTRFGVADRLLLTGHSHQAWPDVALDGLQEAFADAAGSVDGKWESAFAKADQVREGLRRFVGAPGAEVALGASTHDLILRVLSALDLGRRPQIVTSDAEFHTVRRQLDRLGEAGVEVVRVAAEPVSDLAARIGDRVGDRTAAVLVSAVLFETALIVPGLGDLAATCRRHGAELIVDAYHAVGVIPFTTEGLESAWIVGGGYKYLQLGEGNCYLVLPAHADDLRPVITGWYAEFAELDATPAAGRVGYPRGAARYTGATYDPASHYRAAAVLDFFTAQDLSPDLLRKVSQHQVGLLADRFDAIDVPPPMITRDRSRPLDAFAGFLTLRTPFAAQLCAAMQDRGVLVDSRGPHLRMGPAPYLSDAQLISAADHLAAAVAGLGRSGVPADPTSPPIRRNVAIRSDQPPRRSHHDGYRR